MANEPKDWPAEPLKFKEIKFSSSLLFPNFLYNSYEILAPTALFVFLIKNSFSIFLFSSIFLLISGQIFWSKVSGT